MMSDDSKELQNIPSSLSTSFCNFWTERSANSARASAYKIKIRLSTFVQSQRADKS